MQIALPRLRTLSVAFWVLVLAFQFYSLHRKYQSISVCQAQQGRLDVIEAQIDSLKK